MKGLAGLVISLFDLCEAEGRLLQESVIATVQRSVILTLGLIFGAAALAFLVASAYTSLRLFIAAPIALAIMAVICACIAGIMLWSVKRKKKKPMQADQNVKPESQEQ